MEIHFRDILISQRFADFSFTNPVPLRWEQDGEIVGSAFLKAKKKELYANLILNQRIEYSGVWPHVAIDAVGQVIGYIFLSKTRSIDPAVLPLTDQLLGKK